MVWCIYMAGEAWEGEWTNDMVLRGVPELVLAVRML